MTKTNPSRKLKKTAAFFAAVLMCISCLCMSASAARSYKNYAFQTSHTGSGEYKWMDAGKVEYTDVLVSCRTSSARASLELWKKWWTGDIPYEQNQDVTVGSGKRAWWFVDSGNSADYHVTAVVSNNFGKTMSFEGDFQNF